MDGGTARPSALAVLRFDHLELGRELHREIARLGTAQDAIDIGGGATPGIYGIGSVGEQAAVSGKVRSPIRLPVRRFGPPPI